MNGRAFATSRIHRPESREGGAGGFAGEVSLLLYLFGNAKSGRGLSPVVFGILRHGWKPCPDTNPRVSLRRTVPTLRLRSGQVPLAAKGAGHPLASFEVKDVFSVPVVTEALPTSDELSIISVVRESISVSKLESRSSMFSKLDSRSARDIFLLLRRAPINTERHTFVSHFRRL